MIKLTRTYTDYDGNERTEDFRFNLSQAEIAEMELSEEGGYEQMLRRVIAEKDNRKIVEIFKGLVLKAYGVKSPDGRRFIKSAALSEEFSQTEAYSDLFMELATNAEKASEFVTGIMPESLKNSEGKLLSENNNHDQS